MLTVPPRGGHPSNGGRQPWQGPASHRIRSRECRDANTPEGVRASAAAGASRFAHPASTMACSRAGSGCFARRGSARADSPTCAARLARHRALDCFLLLGRERHRGRSPVELLDVDTRVVASLDRRDDRTGARRIEECVGRRLLAARVLVGVVADDRRVVIAPSTRRSTRDRPAATSSTARWRSSIRPCSETAKSTRSWRAPSEQHVLPGPQPAQADPQQGDRRERENGHGARGECDPEGEAHGAASEKITGNSALLFALFVSP